MFSEKLIVAFTSSTVFIPVWSHVLAFSAWTLKKTHSQLPGSLSPYYKYLHASQISHRVFSPKPYLNV